MTKVIVNDKEYELLDKDAALVEAIKALTGEIRRLVSNA